MEDVKRAYDPAEAVKLQRKAEILGRVIEGAAGPGVGFALFLFNFNGEEMTMASNAGREGMIAGLEEFIVKAKAGVVAGPAGRIPEDEK